MRENILIEIEILIHNTNINKPKIENNTQNPGLMKTETKEEEFNKSKLPNHKKFFQSVFQILKTK